MSLQRAIEVFDKSAARTTPNAQTEAWSVIRATLADIAALADGLSNGNSAAEGEAARYAHELREAFHQEPQDE